MATTADLGSEITCGEAVAGGQGILQCGGPASPEEATSDACMLLSCMAWARPALFASCRLPQLGTHLHCTKVMPRLQVYEPPASMQSHTYVARLLCNTKCHPLCINIMRRTS